MKILFLAFVKSQYPQILEKVNQQYLSLKKAEPEAFCFVIGTNLDHLDMSNYSFTHIDTSEVKGKIFRKTHFDIAQQIIDQLNPDVVYFRYPMFDSICYEFVKKNEKKVIFEIHSKTIYEVSEQDKKNEIEYASRIYEHTAGIVCVTQELADYERERCHNNQPIFVMPNGINTDTIPFTKFNNFGHCFELLCIANFSSWHGYDRLLRGLANSSFKSRF